MPTRVKVTLSDTTGDLLLRSKPESLSMSTFCALLIEQALDAGAIIWGKGERGLGASKSSTTYAQELATNKEVSTPKEVSIKHVSKRTVPETLQTLEPLIREFWQAKKGSKGDTAWKLLMTELTKIKNAHGLSIVEEQLHLAINAKWQGITLRNFENFSKPVRAGQWNKLEEKPHPCAERRGAPSAEALKTMFIPD